MDEIIEIRDKTIDSDRLYQQIRQRVAAREADGAYGPDPASTGPASLRPHSRHNPSTVDLSHSLRASLLDLMIEHRLQEPNFTSALPVLGSLIVLLRRAWNWMSTKWYVIPIMQQQSGINAQMTLLMQQIIEWHAVSRQEIAQLEARVATLEAQLRQQDAV